MDSLRFYVIIDCDQDVLELDDYQARNLMHADRCHVVEAPVRVVVLEIAMLRSVQVTRVDQADDFRLMDFDFALQTYL